MSTAQGQNRANAELERLRRGGRQNSGSVAGYSTNEGIREVQGDEDAPFGKVPPFPRLWELLLEDDNLPIRSFGVSEEFDVEAIRLLTVWIDYLPAVNDSVLGFAAEVRNTENENDWYPIGVIDGAVDVVEVSSAVNYGSRNMYPAMFRSPIVDPANAFRQTINFDVGPYKQMRFLAGNFTAELGMQLGGRLILRGSVSE